MIALKPAHGRFRLLPEDAVRLDVAAGGSQQFLELTDGRTAIQQVEHLVARRRRRVRGMAVIGGFWESSVVIDLSRNRVSAGKSRPIAKLLSLDPPRRSA